MEWVDAIVYALVLVYFIFTFLFQNFQIPSSSLEKTLLVGDYLFVSKLSYGPRVPNTPFFFPLAQHTMPVIGTKSYIDWPQWDYHRLKGLGNVKRNDIVVFNFPAGDTVALKMQNPDYYTLVHYYGRDAIHRNKDLYGDIIYRPVDRRENYVKRCVGLPGDTFHIINNDIYIDGIKQQRPKNMQLNYYVATNGVRINEQQFRDMDISVADRTLLNNENGYSQIMALLGIEPETNGEFNPVYRLPLTEKALKKIKNYSFVTKVIPEPGYFGGDTYPLVSSNNWTRSDYGPVWIPRKGETIQLTLENLPVYERIIRNYEKNILEVKDSKIFINGKESPSYTFKMDYYMMLGDNRDNSADSRYWGFVPEDHIVGKPLFVWMSLDNDRGLFDGRFRTSRFLKNVSEE